MSTQTAVADLGARPAAATGAGHLLRAELRRLTHRRLVLVLAALALVAVVGGMAIAFFTHNQDVVGARAEAVQQAQSERADCLATAEVPPGQDIQEMCPSVEDSLYFNDPRFRPDPDLAVTAMTVAGGGALLAALLGATAVGADWSSRAMITLLTWEPRRLRLLGTRYAAVAILCAGLGVLLQLVALALGAITVSARGTWARTTVPAVEGPGMNGMDGSGMDGPTMLGLHTFWRDLLSLQLRGVALMVLTGILAAAITTLARHTGGLLGLLFGWFAVAENALRAFGSQRGWDRWLLSSNIGSFLAPGGQAWPTGERIARAGGDSPDTGEFRTVLVSNLDALLYLGLVTAFFVLLAGLLLRRRDL